MLNPLIQYINDNFGSKRGLVASIKYKILFMLGYYRAYQTIDFAKVSRLVFVCQGNICRSSFGEYMARAKGVNAVSFGLRCRGGDNADPRAINEARLRGVDMQAHITRNISEYIEQESDLILVMEPGHLNELQLLGISQAQLTITPLWANKASAYLHDPFNSSSSFFTYCESVVEQCVDNIYAALNQVSK